MIKKKKKKLKIFIKTFPITIVYTYANELKKIERKLIFKHYVSIIVLYLLFYYIYTLWMVSKEFYPI